MVGTSIRIKQSTKEKLIENSKDKTISQEQMILNLISDNKRLTKEVEELKQILLNIKELKNHIKKQ